MQNEGQDNSKASIENSRQKHDADRKNDGSSSEMLQKEKLIDDGNEHHHSADTKDENPSTYNADSASDATGTTGPEQGEGKNDAPDTSGEDG